MVELPFAADCCPREEKLRTVLTLTVGIRDSVVHLVSTLRSAVISRRGEGCGVCCTTQIGLQMRDAKIAFVHARMLRLDDLRAQREGAGRETLCSATVGDAESSLGDAESSLGDAESSLGDAKSLAG